MSTPPTIEHAVELAKAGDREAALQLVIEILKADTDHAEAWILAACLTDEHEQQVHALQQVLALRPDDTWATEQLRRIEDGLSLLQPPFDEIGTQTSEDKTKSKTPVNASLKDKGATKRPVSVFRIAGIALGALVVIALGTAVVLNFLPQPAPAAPLTESPAPDEMTQIDTPLPVTSEQEPTPDLIATSEDSPPVPTTTVISISLGGPPPNAKEATVVKVIDGNTIEVELDGKTEIVRYLGTRVPTLEEPCGQPAADFNASLVEGYAVSVVREVSDLDSEGRLLRHVYVGSLYVNAEIIAQGFALAVLVPPDLAQSDTFRSLEQQAREGNMGCLHRQPSEGVTTEASTPPGADSASAAPPTTSSSDGPPNYPTSTP